MKTHTHTHTPGPWRIDSQTRFGDFTIAAGQNVKACKFIAKTQDEANAQLIAAAPELLAALHDLLGHAAWVCPSVRDGMRVELGAAIKHAEKAIAKAEGRA